MSRKKKGQPQPEKKPQTFPKVHVFKRIGITCERKKGFEEKIKIFLPCLVQQTSSLWLDTLKSYCRLTRSWSSYGNKHRWECIYLCPYICIFVSLIYGIHNIRYIHITSKMHVYVKSIYESKVTIYICIYVHNIYFKISIMHLPCTV